MKAPWPGRIFAVVVVWALLWAYAVLSSRGPQPALLATAVLGVFVVGWIAADVGSEVRPVTWLPPGQFEPFNRGADHRFTSLVQSLSESTDRERVAAEIHQAVVAVADDLLVSRYGVNRRQDPETARETLGDMLWTYVTSPPRFPRTGYRAYLSQILDELESL